MVPENGRRRIDPTKHVGDLLPDKAAHQVAGNTGRMQAMDAGAADRPIVQDVARQGAVNAKSTLMLVMLTVIYAFNYLDRQIVLVLQEPLKTEFTLQDWQLGLLTGGSISLFYTTLSIPIARVVDRGIHRVRMIAAITVLWSVLTAAGGITRSYVQLFTARMGVGMAEAGYTPAAHSLLSDLFPAKQRPAAMGVFATGVPIGMMLGLVLGGYIAQHYGWRSALLIVGMPGVLVGFAFLFLAREPVRGESEEHAPPENIGKVGFKQALSELWHRPAYVHVVLASAAASFVQMGVLSWLPPFLGRVHHMSLSEIGFQLGIVLGCTGLFGTWFGGWLAAHLGKRGMHAMLWAPIIGLTISIPFHIMAFMAVDKYLTIGLLVIPMITVAFWTAPSIAVTQSLAPVATRATASAVYIVGANVIGVAMGPIFAGILSDVLNSVTGNEAQGLRLSLIVMSVLMVWSITHWLIAARYLRKG